MSLALPKPLSKYDVGNEAQTRSAMEQADKKNVKVDGVISTLSFRDQVTKAITPLSVLNGLLSLGGAALSYLPLSGGTISGNLTVSGALTANLGSATGLPLSTGVTGSLSPPNGGKPSNRYTNFTNTTTFNNATTSFEMGGFGWMLTPSSTGHVRIHVDFNLQQTTGGYSSETFVNYGTGSSPTSGSAEIGTRATSRYQLSFSAGGNVIAPGSMTVEVSGLTIGTAYWFDMAAAAIGGGSVGVTPLSVIIEEF